MDNTYYNANGDGLRTYHGDANGRQGGELHMAKDKEGMEESALGNL